MVMVGVDVFQQAKQITDLKSENAKLTRQYREAIGIIKALANGHDPEFNKGDIEGCGNDGCEVCEALEAARALIAKHEAEEKENEDGA